MFNIEMHIPGFCKSCKFPRFPEEILTGKLSVLQPLINVTETPPQFIFTAFCAALSAVVGRRIIVEHPSPLRLNIFSVMVGEPCLSKKGYSLSLLERFLESSGFPNGQIFGREVKILRTIDSGEGIIEAFPPSEEAIFLLEEISACFKKGGTESSIIFENLNTIFDGKPLQRNVVHKHAHARTNLCSPYAVLLGATTPEHIDTYFNNVLLYGGFSSRVLFVYGKRDKLINNPSISKIERSIRRIQDVIQEFDDNCSNIVQHFGGRLLFSRGARQYHAELYKSIADYQEQNDGVPAYFKERIDIYIKKLAALLDILEAKSTITVNEISKSAHFLTYIALGYEELFRLAGMNEQRRIEEKIIELLRAHGGTLYRRDLQQKVRGRNVDAEKFNRALKALSENEIVIMKGSMVILC